MRWPEFARSTTLRWTALLAAIFAAFVVAMLGFVYLKTKHDLTIRYDRSIRSQMGVLAQLSPQRRLDAIDDNLRQDPGQVRLSGLFGANGHRIAGNLESLPPGLKADDTVQSAVVDRMNEGAVGKQPARLIAHIARRQRLVAGRNVDEVGRSRAPRRCACAV
jgi:hypothetical protein